MYKKQLIDHLKIQGFSQKIIKVFQKIKREDFIPKEYKQYSYQDMPIPIDKSEATISQPFTIAFMLDLLDLQKKHRVLEIGSGSGYVLALMEDITKSKTYGVEIIKDLAKSSQQILKNNENIIVINKSGKNGLPKFAPYDRILVSASARNLNTIRRLTKQLKQNGIIVASVQDSIFKITKNKNKPTTQEFPGFVFVPLID